MPRFLTVSVLGICIALLATRGEPRNAGATDKEPQGASVFAAPQTSVDARSRARMLHELVRGSLQVMHRDFFDEDNAHAIPSASLEDVFREMGRSYNVEMKWLIVNTDIVNVDHQPETEFDKAAVKELAAGKPFAEQIDSNRYHFAGPIRLASQCLKCHVKHRTSTEDRTAGLVIVMPLDAER